MIKLRKQDERGLSKTPWLTSFHSFSFADYYSHRWHHFSHLRVINQDIIAPNSGFGLHSHQNMEIITLMLRGTLTHQDSLGHQQQLHAGEIQLMRAGSGIQHSEMNNGSEAVELLQIWIYPDEENLKPSYQQMQIPKATHNQWITLVSRDQAHTLHIHQNAELALSNFDAGTKTKLNLNPQHHYWLQVIKGDLNANEITLGAGDALAINQETQLAFNCTSECQLLLFHFA